MMKNLHSPHRIFAAFLAAASLCRAADPRTPWHEALEACNIVWDSPGTGSADSMPLAGCNLGLNVWVENNDVLALVGSPDALDENGMQVKLGLIRLHFDAPVLAAGFRQELRLAQSEIVIQGDNARVTIWGEAGRTVAHMRIESKQPVRRRHRLARNLERLRGEGRRRRNPVDLRRLPGDNARRLRDLKAQGLAEAAALAPDPLPPHPRRPSRRAGAGGGRNRPGEIQRHGHQGLRDEDRRAGAAARSHADPAYGAGQGPRRVGRRRSRPPPARPPPNAKPRAPAPWWKDFWDRSHISIRRAGGVVAAADKPWLAARNYQLVRASSRPTRRGGP
ncbi:MAG: DUF5703 domain-containing protein [Kiritimatiellia bacterium]